jgi:EPS-associated MarR family transcriptional regulator
MASRQKNLQEDTNFRVMRLIENSPELTQRELANLLGLSVGGVNYCLKALIQKGFVKVSNFKQSKNKFGYIYLLTPAGVGEKIRLTTSFLERKMQEYEAIKAEIETLGKQTKL